MKNQFFGDNKDYHKYGLLRALVRAAGYRPLLAWMRTPDDSSTDGQDVGYLEKPETWATYDSDLFSALRHLVVRRGIRKLAALKHLPLFAEFDFYGKVLPPTAAERQAWFERLLARSSEHDLVFFDPDNGLEIASVSHGQRNAVRYLYYDELAPFVTPDRLVLIYQHYPREPRPEFEARIAAKLRDRARFEHVTVLRTPSVGFFAAYSKAEQGRVSKALEGVQSEWGERFKIISL